MNNKINKNTIPENFTLGLAIYDIFPVLFFGISVILLGAAMDSILFLIGALLCAWAGITKVLWKILVVTRKKNIWWMFLQMRICMPIGFILMIAGGIICRNQEKVVDICSFSTQFPVSVLLIIGFIGMLLMGIAAAILDSADVKSNWIEQTINTIAQFSIFLAVVFLTLSVGYLHADEAAMAALCSDEEVTVTTESHEVIFSPVTEPSEIGLIFYPGAKVEYTAYAPLLRELSRQGITCFLVEMPLNYAFLGTQRASDVISAHPEIKSWYLAGHSLGGAFAGVYASEHSDILSGVILLGAYSTKDLANLPVLSVYGSEDGVLQKDKYEANKSNLPPDFTECIISGGNHAMFGSYGMQPGDQMGLISPMEQWRITAEEICDFVA